MSDLRSFRRFVEVKVNDLRTVFGEKTMSYTGNEPLTEIIHELRAKLETLQNRLHGGEDIEVLHGLVEMLECLILRYERGEIVDMMALEES